MARNDERTPWKGGRCLISREFCLPNPYTGKRYHATDPSTVLAMALSVQRWASMADDAIKKAMRTT